MAMMVPKNASWNLHPSKCIKPPLPTRMRAKITPKEKIYLLKILEF
jgi:hypothetical protein